ncbi:hypothetical protein GH714_006645 [Hevea brasiliensis]|uniref:Pectinesterase n=1 Tax=Hevea brasiliensis TaxID=3981 RepID=A0A6A6M7Z2_HEVBR|nr:hypothetical protein GH714_006645 [Hevea brasiliensis]
MFRDQSLLVTMNQAIEAHQMISNMDLSSFDNKAKLAWTDCLELYEDTVDHLNRSLSSRNPIDSQTWLSAAIANQQTCKNGFIDFNLAYHLESLPFMVMSNLSKLLTNSLAINKATVSSSYNTNKVGGRRLLADGFPRWVSAGDRRLLQSSRVQRQLILWCLRRRLYCQGHDIREYSRTAETPSGGPPVGLRFLCLLQLQLQGLPRHLYVYSQRQFYRNCDIYGTIDFIFGDAVVVLQNCNIYVRKPMSNQKNTVTAQARTDPNENTGIVIHNSRVTAASDLGPLRGSFKTYLGRPWQKYSRTLFMKSNLDGLIDQQVGYHGVGILL